MCHALGSEAIDSLQSEFAVLRVGFASTESSCVLTLCGELNGTSIPALEAQIDQIGRSDCEDVVLDVTALIAIDSVGIRVLIGLDHYVRALGARLTIAGARGKIGEVLAGSCLDLVGVPESPGSSRQQVVQSSVLLTEGIPL